MVQINRVGKNYADNLIDYDYAFNSSQTWTVASGTGLCNTDTNYAFNGLLSLKIENTVPTSDIVVSNASLSTTFTRKLDNCALSFYLYKSDASYAYSGEVKIFKNAILLDTQTFDLSAIQDGAWYRFVTDTTYSFVTADVITFTIQLDAIVGHPSQSKLWVDGIMMYVGDDRLDFMPPIYTPPQKETVETNIVSKTSNYSAVDGDIVLADATTGNLTVTLQSASVNATITVKKVDSSVNLVILDGDGAETIDGSTTQNITNQWDSITVKSDGSNWYII